MSKDWSAWHEPYDEPGSYLARRLLEVQAAIERVLDADARTPLHVVSMCAGQGRDLLGVLADHPNSGDVQARLVELDPDNVAVARAAIADVGLVGVEVTQGDAGTSDVYAGAVPAELVLACGVFGNITAQDIEGTIGALPMLCAAGATVIWTRHRLEPDLTPNVRRWFAESGFREESVAAPDDALFTVGVHRLDREPEAFRPGERLFEFVQGRR